MATKRDKKGRGPAAWVTSTAYKAAIATIVEARKRAELTQRDVTDALGKKPSWLAKIEKIERRMDIIEFIAIARVLHIKEGDLLRSIVCALPKVLDV